MFILTLEWFGLPDDRKRHGIQLEYGFKGMTQRRAAPDVDGRGGALRGGGRPATSPRTGTRERSGGSIDCPFPARFDEERKRWLLEDGPISWEEVMIRWKGRGPMNQEYVGRLQRGYRGRLGVAA